jgi:hypothetical protein
VTSPQQPPQPPSENTQQRLGSYVEEILAEQMKQEEARRKAQQAKVKVVIRPADLLKVVGAVALVLIVRQLYIDQKPMQALVMQGEPAKKSHALDPEDIFGFGDFIKDKDAKIDADHGEKLKVSAQSAVNELAKQFRKFGKQMSEDDLKFAAKIIADKPLDALTTDSQSAKSSWSALLECSLNSPWRPLPRLRKLGDQVGVFDAGDRLFIFTPYFAGEQRLFSGVYWQRPVVTIGSKMGEDMTSWIPQRSIAFPYLFQFDRAYFRGYFYADFQRRRQVDLHGVSLGDLFQLHDDTNRRTQMIPLGSAMWKKSDKASIAAKGQAMLVKELRLRLMKPTMMKLLYYNRYHADALVARRETLDQCRKAARAYQLPSLEQLAKTTLESLRQPSQPQVPIFSIGSPKLTGNYPLLLAEAHLRLNQGTVVDCMQRNLNQLRNGRGRMTMKIEDDGSTSTFQFYSDNPLHPAKRVSKCINDKLALMMLPSSGEHAAFVSVDWKIE